MNQILRTKKIGFLGAGNMAQAIIRGLLETDFIQAKNIWVSNRTPGKLQKLQQERSELNLAASNEELVEKSDIVIIAVKPQDLLPAIEPVAREFTEHHIVISMAAGIKMETLEKHLQQVRLVRLMPNTPTLIGRGVLGYLLNNPEDAGLDDLVESLFSKLGLVMRMADEDQLEAVTVAASAGTGFVFELMMYWQDWIEEHGFDSALARKMTIETFLGAAQLAQQSQDISLEELQARVASRKGVTASGLQSMRELEIERALRISFEKAAMRNSELSRDLK
jgi:pyrroline-5-carboxylate reductase